MLKAIEGMYNAGKVELKETPADVLDGTLVVVTFLGPGITERRARVEVDGNTAVELRDHGIGEARAADLRDRLSTFAEDWDRPEMAVYDDYDART